MRLRAVLAAFVLAALALAGSGLDSARGAEPQGGTLGNGRDKEVVWSGKFAAPNPAVCAGAVDPTCDHFYLTIEPRKKRPVKVMVAAEAGNFLGLSIWAPDGSMAAQATEGTNVRTAYIANPVAGTYEVRVQPEFVEPGTTYHGQATFAREIDVEQECFEFTPPYDPTQHAVHPEANDISLDVAVLLDGVDQTDGERAFETAKRPYDGVGIELTAVSYTAVSFADDGIRDRRSEFEKQINPAGAPKLVPTADAIRMNADAKAFFGGARPEGADLVYLLTNKDLYVYLLEQPQDPNDPNDGARKYAVAGLADCIGGVRYANRAFAVGEVVNEIPVTDAFGPVPATGFYRDGTAKVAAHELGHLMGGHHHHGNCAEGDPLAIAAGDLAPCTLMNNFADMAGLKFSTVNGAMVRGHAEHNATP